MLRVAKWALIVLAAVQFSGTAVAQRIDYLSPEEAISLEHQSRYARLKRFVEAYDIVPAPEFFDYVVTADRMPTSFAHDTPVLRIVFPENAFFDTDSAVVLPGALRIIAAMAKMLDGDVPDVNVFVAGHTDSRGSEDYNQSLSISRAKAVTQALLAARSQSYTVWSIGFGKSLPLYPNINDTNMSFNRRVEFLLAARPEAVADWLQKQYSLVCKTDNAADKLSCLLGVKKLRRIYEAEEAIPKRITITMPTAHKGVAVTPEPFRESIAPKRLTIQLDERRLYVPSIEH